MCRAELEQLLVVAAQATTAAGEGGTRGGDDIKVCGEGEAGEAGTRSGIYCYVFVLRRPRWTVLWEQSVSTVESG